MEVKNAGRLHKFYGVGLSDRAGDIEIDGKQYPAKPLRTIAQDAGDYEVQNVQKKGVRNPPIANCFIPLFMEHPCFIFDRMQDYFC